KGLKENRLVTHGVYAYVRNPIYSAWIFICTGILLLGHDIWAFVLCPIFWAYLTVLMKHTEEKWLINQYGQQYLDYMKKVNRVFPWFPRR
ncbi:MAG: methyltransferase family protein, partial [Filifactor alocis]